MGALWTETAMESENLNGGIGPRSSLFKTHETGSVVATQRRCRIHFNVPRHGRIPSRKTILQWMSKLENSGSLLDVKYGPPKTITTPENEAQARQAFERSPHCSARKQARFVDILSSSPLGSQIL
ncbi:hypothetical protein C0J52_10660 [Blattella germanica]|nr:hypothetical protein C0J52_10660 [Blattella germanica]